MSLFDTIDNEFRISGQKIHIDGTTLYVNDVSAGGGWDHASGTWLWNRDDSLSGKMNSDIVGLSDEVALVSGLAGGWDHASGTLLWNRDDSLSGKMNSDIVGLSDEVALVSGLAGGWDHASGTLLWNRDLSLSGSMDAKVLGLSDNVATLSGNVVFSSETGGYLDLANETALELRDTNLSANVATLSGNVVFNSETGGYLDLASETALELRDTLLSDEVALISGNIDGNTTLVNGLSTNVATLSGDLETRDTNLSANVATLSGTVSTNTTDVTDLQDISGAAQKALFIDYITDEEDFPFFFTDRPLTCLSVNAVAKGESATASITWTLDYGTDATAAGTQIIADITTSITTVDTNTTFDNASIPANNFVLFRSTATGASTTGLSITLIHE